MFKKAWVTTAACVLAFSVFAGTALAKSDNGANGQGNGQGNGQQVSVDNGKVKLDPNTTVTSSTYGQTVTSSTYGHNGSNGLLHAIENTQDKPAGAVIANLLLTKYASRLTAEQIAKFEAIVDKAEALSTAADVLEQQGSVTEAVYARQDAIKADIRNIDSYKKLGVLYNKLGKTGVKLYVNGDEPSFEVAPFIRDGSTLVPFRAISEALKAEVSWNNDERSVTVTRNGITVKLYIDSKTAYVDGKEVQLEVPAAIVQDNTVVPVRFVSEAFKAAVQWEGETQSVVIVQ